MDEGWRCPRCGLLSPTVATLNEALLAIGREKGVQATLSQIVEAARRLSLARGAALGIAGEDGAIVQLVSVGLDGAPAGFWRSKEASALLRATLAEPSAVRIPDMRSDPRAAGTPEALAAFGSFLGVALRGGERAAGALYLFGREGAPAFTAADQEAVQMLTSHAVLAIENARLYDRSRELTVMEERNRLARDLHDAVSQTLFSVVLTAGSVETLLDQDPDEARRQVGLLRQLAHDAQREMRALIFELRPADVGRDGLASTVRKHIEVLRRVYPAAIDLAVEDEGELPAAVERELFRVQQEALSNALKHADASHVSLELRYGADAVRMVVADDGKGFDPEANGDGRRSLGLTSMRERVAALGGRLVIESAPGKGTRVSVEVPREG